MAPAYHKQVRQLYKEISMSFVKKYSDPPKGLGRRDYRVFVSERPPAA